MKRAFAIVMMAAGCAAATTVAEAHLVVAGGTLASGYFTIRPSAAFTTPAGDRVDGGDVTVNVVNGRFSLVLAPNDTGNPANTRYLVAWHLTGAAVRPEVWSVPTTGATLAVKDVVSTYIAPTQMVAPSQIQQGGASTGQAMCWSGSSWGPGTCGGGSSWSVNSQNCTASPVFDLSLGSIQKIQLTCNVTAASVTGLTSNTVAMWTICQDATGGRTFAWPAAVKGAVTVGATANKCTSQWFYSVDGTTMYSQGIGEINQ